MAAQAASSGLSALGPPGLPALPGVPGVFPKSDPVFGDNPILAAAKAAAGQIAAKAGMGIAAPTPTPSAFAPGAGIVPLGERRFEAELEINDFPQHARWKVKPHSSVPIGSSYLSCRSHIVTLLLLSMN